MRLHPPPGLVRTGYAFMAWGLRALAWPFVAAGRGLSTAAGICHRRAWEAR